MAEVDKLTAWLDSDDGRAMRARDLQTWTQVRHYRNALVAGDADLLRLLVRVFVDEDGVLCAERGGRFGVYRAGEPQ